MGTMEQKYPQVFDIQSHFGVLNEPRVDGNEGWPSCLVYERMDFKHIDHYSLLWSSSYPR